MGMLFFACPFDAPSEFRVLSPMRAILALNREFLPTIATHEQDIRVSRGLGTSVVLDVLVPSPLKQSMGISVEPGDDELLELQPSFFPLVATGNTLWPGNRLHLDDSWPGRMGTQEILKPLDHRMPFRWDGPPVRAGVYEGGGEGDKSEDPVSPGGLRRTSGGRAVSREDAKARSLGNRNNLAIFASLRESCFAARRASP